jgi:hypothetical protein
MGTHKVWTAAAAVFQPGWKGGFSRRRQTCARPADACMGRQERRSQAPLPKPRPARNSGRWWRRHCAPNSEAMQARQDEKRWVLSRCGVRLHPLQGEGLVVRGSLPGARPGQLKRFGLPLPRARCQAARDGWLAVAAAPPFGAHRGASVAQATRVVPAPPPLLRRARAGCSGASTASPRS